jgi:RNA polymerase sigma-70 factor (ECF subfamily)
MTAVGLSPDELTEQARTTTRRLYEQHGQRVLTFCLRRLRDREEAQDAAQTTFVYVLKALERGVVPRHELAWLLKIAENVCHSSGRALGRRRAVTSSADVTELGAAAESLSAEASEQLHDLREALEQLPENQRRTVLLREWQGLSYAEIADDLQLSVPAVEALLFRARRAIAAHLRRTQSRLLDLGSSLAATRSLLQGGTAKVAVAAAVVGGITAPAIVHEPRHSAVRKEPRASAPATAATAFREAPPRARATALRRPVARVRTALGRTAARTPAARSAAEPAPTMKPPPAAETSAPLAPPADAPTAPASAPAGQAPAAVPPAAAPVAEPVASAVSTVVAAAAPVAEAVAVPPLPSLPGG